MRQRRFISAAFASAATIGLCLGLAPSSTASSGGSSAATDSSFAPESELPIPGKPGVSASLDGPRVPDESWCRVVLRPRADQERRAAEIMNGYVDMGMYGHFTLKDKPDWRPQDTLDSSGNSHMHGLYWASPLLYVGVRDSNEQMVERFYEILRSWLERYPSKRAHTRPWSIDQDIVAGERLWTLSCAADLTGEKFWRTTIAREAKQMSRRFRMFSGINNVAIHAQSSALAAYCILGRPDEAAQAQRNLEGLAKYLVLDDGSDREGSPHYAYYTYRLLLGSQAIVDKCGATSRTVERALDETYSFFAHATRPDFRFETIGDTDFSQMDPDQVPADSPAYFMATEGREGKPPTKTYASFAGGYAFGRSGWYPGPKGQSPTFYSVRTGLGPTPTAHTHNDIGSVTYFTGGSELIGDPGPWRYDGSSLRSFIVSRAAHSAMSVRPLMPKGLSKKKRKRWSPPASRPSSQLLGARTSAAGDRTCVADTTYPTVRMTRCVSFDRASGRLQVNDTAHALERSELVQRWVVPDGVGVSLDGLRARLSGVEAEADLTMGGTPVAGVTRATAAFTRDYGEVGTGAAIARKAVLSKSDVLEWTTTITPDGPPPPNAKPQAPQAPQTPAN